MMIEVLVEEPSAEAALNVLLPKVLGQRARFRVINLGSKAKLLAALPARLQAYRERLSRESKLRLLVLVDRDDEDCIQLKNRLESMTATVELPSKSRPGTDGKFVIVNRIVVVEPESWFIGDPGALRASFTSLPPIEPSKSIFRNPDNGGTWEALARFLRKHNVYKGHYPKIEAARKIAGNMDPARSRSKSLTAFVSGLEALIDS